MSLQINFNGKTYNSLDEMPPEARQAYEQAMALLADQNANGVPDFLDSLLQGQSPEAILKPLHTLTAAHTQIVFNGQSYASLDAMPADARQAYQQAMSGFDQNRNGVPDAFEPGALKPGQSAVSVMSASAPTSAPPPLSPTPYTPAGLEPEGPAANARRVRTVAFAAFGLAALALIVALVLVAVFVFPNILGPR